MKKILTLVLIGLLIVGCSNDDDGVDSTIINAELFKNAPSDGFIINSLAIVNDNLTINLRAGGCNGDTWELKLIDSESVFESNPPQRNLRLSLKNEEACQAFITQELDFDISNLQVEGNQVLLNITNSDQTVLYEY